MPETTLAVIGDAVRWVWWSFKRTLFFIVNHLMGKDITLESFQRSNLLARSLEAKVFLAIAVGIGLMGIGIFLAQQTGFPLQEPQKWGVCTDTGCDVDKLRNLFLSLGFLLGLIAALIGLANSLHRTVQQDKDVEAKMRTTDAEIFSGAVMQISDEKITTRLGGLYALEQLARLAEDHEDRSLSRMVLETLAAYVRERAVKPARKITKTYRLPEDIVAAVRILARNFDYETGYRPSLQGDDGVNLTRTYLPGLKMPRRSDLRGFNLERANLQYSSFPAGNFSHTDLRGINFSYAYLGGAVFSKTVMWNANFLNADINSADFSFASIGNVICLDGAWVSNVKGLDTVMGEVEWSTNNPPKTFGDDGKLDAIIAEQTENIIRYETYDKEKKAQKLKTKSSPKKP